MSETIYLVYKHTSPSGKSYIGITSNYDVRCNRHQQTASSKCRAFSAAIQKYGWDNFTHEILSDNLTYDEANLIEPHLITLHNTLVPNGYNLLSGGNSGGLHHDTTKQFMSEQRKGRPSNRKGVKLSDATKIKVSAASAGIPMWTNGKITTRSKASPGEGWRRGRPPLTNDHKQKISDSMTGIKRSDEFKHKISHANQGCWWNNGVKNKRAFDCPGEGWIKGSLPHHKNRD